MTTDSELSMFQLHLLANTKEIDETARMIHSAEKKLMQDIAEAEISISNMETEIKRLKTEYLSSLYMRYYRLSLDGDEDRARTYKACHETTINELQKDLIEYYAKKYGDDFSYVGGIYIDKLLCRSMVVTYMILMRERGLTSDEEEALHELSQDLENIETNFRNEIAKL